MTELYEVDRWINEALSANGTIIDETNGVDNTLAIQGKPAPYITFTPRGEPIITPTLCGSPALIVAIYDIVVTGRDGGFDQIDAAAGAINHSLALYEEGANTYSARLVEASGERPRFWVKPVSIIRRMTQEQTETYRAGGVYEFSITP